MTYYPDPKDEANSYAEVIDRRDDILQKMIDRLKREIHFDRQTGTAHLTEAQIQILEEYQKAIL